MRCDRCNQETSLTQGSYFSLEILCMECAIKETYHPDYGYAKRVELEAVQRGDYNFPGVGWPGYGGRVTRSEEGVSS